MVAAVRRDFIEKRSWVEITRVVAHGDCFLAVKR